MKKYPFKFLDAYNQKDIDIFFGRDQEIKALYEMVFQNSIVLVYGGSGTGKTSLIQCGLAGKFKSYDWLPVIVRRLSNLNKSLEDKLKENGGDFENDDDDINSPNEIKLTGLSKLIQNVYLNNFRPIYLIFDQFEELYILGNKEEEKKFIEAIKEILATEQPVKLIFSIREEYLGYLYEFERAVPQLLRKKLRVEAMTIDKVTDVLTGINNYKNSNVRIKTDEIPTITEGIFNRLKGKKKTLTIQLPYLQVFLDKLYLEITNDESRQADAEITNEKLQGIGDIGDVMRDFLEDQVKSISQKQSSAGNVISADLIWKILSPFSTLEGTKEPIQKKDLQDRLTGIDKKLIDDCLTEFGNRRILNYSENENHYELAHDTLAKCIAEKRSDEDIALLEIRRLINNQVAIKADARETFTEKQLNFIAPYLNNPNLNLNPEEKNLIQKSKEKIETDKREKEEARKIALEAKEQKKKMKRTKMFIVVISVFALMAIIASFNAFIQKANMEKARNLSEADRKLIDLALQNEKQKTNNYLLTSERLQKTDSLLKLIYKVAPQDIKDKIANVTNGISETKKELVASAVGDLYQGGIIFNISPDGKNGLIAYPRDLDDELTWEDAKTACAALGEGWRLPTQYELQTMYKTIGPGANNVGGFDNALYWSSSIYEIEKSQAWLVHFRNGNSDYRYNRSKAGGRKYKARPIQAF